ncbi:hypothetical protein NQ314_007916 [Rhamnusium bicolor]|uniref:Uncharacterized protein n=1 Tax=Rhamnusium bicolor TaxID=1586634 RepID=A0AAV8YIR3_9CUCU|nr:hypothetical protein NQ314_007916 [Rhamnusium bicolor]
MIYLKEFAARKEVCKVGTEPPPSTAYPRDDLRCGSSVAKASSLLFATLIINIIMFRKYVLRCD